VIAAAPPQLAPAKALLSSANPQMDRRPPPPPKEDADGWGRRPAVSRTGKHLERLLSRHTQALLRSGCPESAMAVVIGFPTETLREKMEKATA
jgi:hypothetical protein